MHPASCVYSLYRSTQSQQVNEVEEVIKELKTNPGFSAYVIMNNDGECAQRERAQGRQTCGYSRPRVEENEFAFSTWVGALACGFQAEHNQTGFSERAGNLVLRGCTATFFS